MGENEAITPEQTILRVGDRPEAERRACSRYYFGPNPVVRFLVRPSFQCSRAILKDLSVEGIGLMLNRKLEPGTVLVVQLRGGRRGTSQTRLARVVQATPHDSGHWLIGCKLTWHMNTDELWALLEEDQEEE